MSSIVVVDAAEEAFLDLITDVDMTLRLYKNDATAGLTASQIDALAAGSFTEANFAGYASTSMTTAWTTTQGNPSVATRAEVTFTRSSTGTAQLIYGYYVTRNSDGALRWFEQFDGPLSVEFINDAIKVTPTLALDDVKGNAVEAGTIVMTGRTTAPTGWLLCQGQAVSRTTFADLFAAVGTAFGVGDGATTFNVPDLRQRFPLGKAAAGTGATLGGTGGAIDHVHDLDTATSHARLAVSNNAGDSALQRKATASWVETHRNVMGTAWNTNSASNTFGLGIGGDSDVANPPFQVVNFKIKT